MINLLLFNVIIGVSSYCTNGLRGDPLLVVQGEKKHYVYFMSTEKEHCKSVAKEINKGNKTAVCGCKILKATDMRDRLKLRCIKINDDKVSSRTTGIYYYHNSVIEERCKWMCKHLEKQLEK